MQSFPYCPMLPPHKLSQSPAHTPTSYDESHPSQSPIRHLEAIKWVVAHEELHVEMRLLCVLHGLIHTRTYEPA